MHISRTIFGFALAVFLVGCSIRPLPKNVTRDTTLQIINKIRCETREAVIGRFLFVLKDPPGDRLEVSEKNRRLLSKLEHMGTSEKVMAELNWDEVDRETLTRLKVFAGSVISYTFEFRISEQKIKKGNATFKMPFIGGRLDIGLLGGGSDKIRSNFRKIILTDTFYTLVTGKNVEGSKRESTGPKCDSVDKPRKHWIYPITGNIGMAEVINTYVDLQLVTIPLKKEDGHIAFQDVLTFTTNFEVSAKPEVTLDPPVLPKHFRLTKATAEYTAKRDDSHQVAVTITRAPFSLEPPMEEFTVGVGYLKLSDIPTIKEFPEDHEIGLKFRRTFTRPKQPKGKDAAKKLQGLGAGVPTRKLLVVPKRGLGDAIRNNLDQLRRLEDESKQRDLDALIGR